MTFSRIHSRKETFENGKLIPIPMINVSKMLVKSLCLIIEAYLKMRKDHGKVFMKKDSSSP